MSNRLPPTDGPDAEPRSVAGVRSRVVKAQDAADLDRFAMFDPKSLQSACETELESARKQALLIQHEAESAASEALQLAREEGRRQGLELAAREIDERVRQQSQDLVKEHRCNLDRRIDAQLQTITAEIVSERHQWCADWERKVIELSVAIAERLIHREISQSPGTATDMVRKSLEMIAGQQRIIVRLNPDDIQSFGASAEQEVSKLARCEACQVLADPTIESGGCHVETQFGELDATLQTQLKRIIDELQR